jgi:hypothetical protein
VELADQVLGRHLDVVEEHLVEVEVVGAHDRTEGAPGQARAVGGDHQAAQTVVLGSVGVGAHERQDEVGIVRTRGPHLLAVHDEAVAVQHRPRPQAGEIRPGVGLAHAQRSGHVAAEERDGPPPLLLLAAEHQQRRGDDRQPLWVEARVDVAPPHLLLVDEHLEQRRVAAAVLGRVPRHQPAGVEQRLLPRVRPPRQVGGRA